MAEEIKKKKVVSAADAKTVTKAADETKKAAKKVEDATEEAAGTVTGKKKTEEAKPVGNAKGLRIGAVCLWVAAIAFELVAVFTLFGKINITFMNTMTFLIILIVLDLICLVIGSQLWKKANHIDPASKKNKTKFWLWNNMGLIMTILCFVPFVVLLLTNKNADKKMKVVGVACAAIMLIIGGLLGHDWNPVSAEQKEAAMAAITGEVLWTNSMGGKVYHTHEDCQALNRTEELVQGSVEQAIAANRTRLCAFCARRDAITGVMTDEGEVLDVVETVQDVVEQVTEEAEKPAA